MQLQVCISSFWELNNIGLKFELDLFTLNENNDNYIFSLQVYGVQWIPKQNF